jgi:hypothetical protein
VSGINHHLDDDDENVYNKTAAVDSHMVCIWTSYGHSKARRFVGSWYLYVLQQAREAGNTTFPTLDSLMRIPDIRSGHTHTDGTDKRRHRDRRRGCLQVKRAKTSNDVANHCCLVLQVWEPIHARYPATCRVQVAHRTLLGAVHHTHGQDTVGSCTTEGTEAAPEVAV